MMLEKLSQGLRNTLDKLMKSVFVDKSLIEEIVRDIQRALLQSDVDVNLVFELSERIKSRALKEEIPGLTKKEVIMKIVYEELVKFLGEKEARINVTKTPFFIMLVGLYASGKTTTAAKLANYFKKRGFKVAMLQTDTYRPAAYEQLLQLGSQINVDVFGNKNEKNPLNIFEEFKTKLKNYDVVIVDTAGRDALSEDLVLEMKSLKQKIMPDEVLLVLSADIGQAAKKQAEAFHENCGITGVIITKLEGTAKGGGAITACKATGAFVKFIGVGEKINDLEVFDPEGFVSRLLGFGDLKSLLEKVREAVPEEKAEDLTKKFLEGKFTLKDLYDQMIAMKKMGPLSKIVDLIPGFSSFKLPKELLDVQQEKLEKWRYAMDSMTKEELENPDIINISRINRISKGSGVPVSDIRLLLKQYRQSKKLAKMLRSQIRGSKIPKNLQSLMKNFKGINF
ncbi:MAG: signal recognition particle protein Srp54 [Candidatus Woesearchaeota archaeon]